MTQAAVRPSRHTFFCIDGHTCGNPVRLVAGGGPLLAGTGMSEKRQDFLARFDWVRTSLMFEPRGHDVMSGSILYPPTTADGDVGVLFIEVSGCLPMCGHGTIGTVTMALEHGLVSPREPGRLLLIRPRGGWWPTTRRWGATSSGCGSRNVGLLSGAAGGEGRLPGAGRAGGRHRLWRQLLRHRRAAAGLCRAGGALGRANPAPVAAAAPAAERAGRARASAGPDHPRVSHIQWTGRPRGPRAHGRNAVFYGEKAIDRSPCGTGTSARMAQLHARGRLSEGEDFIHESIIGSEFEGRVEGVTELGGQAAIIPSVAGWARTTGHNTIFVDERDPYWRGFQVA